VCRSYDLKIHLRDSRRQVHHLYSRFIGNIWAEQNARRVDNAWIDAEESRLLNSPVSPRYELHRVFRQEAKMDIVVLFFDRIRVVAPIISARRNNVALDLRPWKQAAMGFDGRQISGVCEVIESSNSKSLQKLGWGNHPRCLSWLPGDREVPGLQRLHELFEKVIHQRVGANAQVKPNWSA